MPRPAVPPALTPGWGIRGPAAATLRLGASERSVVDEAAVLGRFADAEARARSGLPIGEAQTGLAEAMLAAGAAALEVPLPAGTAPSAAAAAVGELADRLRSPLVVATSESACAAAALDAGAAGVLPLAPPPAALLAALAASNATMILLVDAWEGADAGTLAEIATSAVTAGLPAERLLLDHRLLRVAPDAPGLAVVASDPPEAAPSSTSPAARGHRSAAFALAIARGARLLRTTDVRTARRTSTTLAAVRQERASHLGAPA